MTRLLSPLVLLTVIVISALAIARLLLFPSTWLSSVAALLFFPVALSVLVFRGKRRAHSVRTHVAVRASLVGGGMLMAAALLESIATQLGWLETDGEGVRAKLVLLAPALIAAGVDFWSARLEAAADDDE